MRILWVKTDFLHPTNRGGQIRTLEMLKRLHAKHEVHYIAYDDPAQPEGRERANEYASYVWPVARPIPPRGSLPFWMQIARNAVSPLPAAVGRFESAVMKKTIRDVLQKYPCDMQVCDFLAMAPNMPDMSRAVLFQHNVETRIWERHALNHRNPVVRAYFRSQAKRMANCERDYCLRAAHVISVSPSDTAEMRERFGVTRISEVPTGVDVDVFARPERIEGAAESDLVFIGAMDWMPNVDGAQWFVSEVLPVIRAARPQTTLTLAGRTPSPEIKALAAADPLIRVTGTVPDIRPWVWNAKASIVPLRIGGGTRLKIYESMAAGTAVVSTPIGAEGLAVTHGQDILMETDARKFAEACLSLLDSAEQRAAISGAALKLVRERFSWESVVAGFEQILLTSRTSA